MKDATTLGGADLDLGHGFHTTAQGIRYTRVRFAISEPALRQVLGRLLELNHARYAAEVAAGLHERKKGRVAHPNLDRKGENPRNQGAVGIALGSKYNGLRPYAYGNNLVMRSGATP